MKVSSTASIFLAAALALGGTQAAFAAAPLNKIVTPGLLGVTVKYAEFMIGSPAMRETIDDLGFQRNVYERDGCYIGLAVQGGQVIGVSMQFDAKRGCDVDVGEITNQPGTLGSRTTFKDYEWRGALHFTDPQLPSCNACGEGSFNAVIDGYGATGNLSVQLTGNTYGPGNNWGAWRELLRANGINGIDVDALPLTAENCPLRRFDAHAYNLLKNTPVTGIAFSRTRGVLQPACNGKTVWSLIMRGS